MSAWLSSWILGIELAPSSRQGRVSIVTEAPLDKEDFASLAGFRYALRHFVAASEKISRDGGVTQQQYQAMLAIKARSSEVMTMGQLAQELLLTHHAAVQMVDRLTKTGLVKREPFLDNRRSISVELTAKGEAVLEALAAKHLEEIRRQEPLLRRSLRGLRRRSLDGIA